MKMTTKEILQKYNLVENIDFTMNGDSYVKIAKTRVVDQVIHHEAIPAKMNGETVIEAAIPAYDETIQVDETYYADFPSDEEILLEKQEITELIEAYLSGKDSLRDMENDSINIVNNRIVDWRFANILIPSRDDLIALIPTVQAKQSKDAILKQIADLEAQITPRRVREAIVNNDNSFIINIDNQIIALRARL